MPSTPQQSIEEIEESISTLRQLEQHMEAVRKDFAPEGNGPQLPSEVTQFHLRREMGALERQIREAIVLAFGEHSSQVRQFRELRFIEATARSFKDGLLILDGFIFDLEQKRLHLLEAIGSPPRPGIDLTTDLYTEQMLARYLDHEVAWSQRQGEPFGLLLLRLRNWPALKQRYDESATKEVVISMACVLKTSLRGYDFPCRLKEAEFGVVLRQANALGVDVVAQRILTHFSAASTRLPFGADLRIEFSSAIYPFDAENIKGLFSYAADHWMIGTDHQCSDLSAMDKKSRRQPKTDV
jgi:diguanylate cyclase (GGDEF)-like protein